MHVNITEKQLAAEQTRLVANALSGERIDDAQFVAVIRDLSTELDYQRRLTHISRHDTLTGLPNRAALAEHTDRAIVDSAGQRGVCALILVSLDHFRPINESLGHAWGDLLLQEMARHLRQIVPPGALIGVWLEIGALLRGIRVPFGSLGPVRGLLPCSSQRHHLTSSDISPRRAGFTLHLNQTAQNPIRLNPYHSSTVFRVHLYNLKPRTTYYYKVDSMESNGRYDGVKSAVK